MCHGDTQMKGQNIMFDYNNKPILVSSKPFNTGELMILSPDIITGCGVDEHKNIFIDVHGMPNTRYYPMDNDVDIIIAICRHMYHNCDCTIDYQYIKNLFTSKTSR